MPSASLSIRIGGSFDARAIKKAEKQLKSLQTQAAMSSGGMVGSFTKMGQGMTEAGIKMQKAGKKIETIGSSLNKLSGIAAGILAGGVKLAADYETGLAKLATITDQTVMSMSEMGHALLEVSTNTGRSVTELQEAAYQAQSASIATADTVGFVEQAVALSKTGFTDTSTAVDTLTTIINAYKISASEAATIGDKLVQTQNKGKTTVAELSETLGQAIPTAAAYGVNLDNLLASYVVLTKQGIATANATTYLNGMMTELSRESSKVSGVLVKETGKAFNELMLEGKSLGDIMGILYDSVDNDSTAFANLWGNVRAGRGALALANAGTAEFNKELAGMGASVGNMDAALEQLVTPLGKARRAINSMKNAGILLGEQVLEELTPTIEKLADGARNLYEGFSNMSDGSKEAIVRLGMLVAVAGPAVTIVGKMVTSVGNLVMKFGQGVTKAGVFASKIKTLHAEGTLASKALAKLGTAIPTIATAAAAVAVTGIVALYSKWKERTDSLRDATDGLGNSMESFASAYSTSMGSIETGTKTMNEVVEASERAIQNQAQLAGSFSQQWRDLGTEAALLKTYTKQIAELSERTGEHGAAAELTKEQQEQLKIAVEEYNRITGETLTITDLTTGALSDSTSAIKNNADAWAENAKKQAAAEMYKEAAKQAIENELALADATDKLNAAKEKEAGAWTEATYGMNPYSAEVAQAQAEVDRLAQAQSSLEAESEKLMGVMTGTGKAAEGMGKSVEGGMRKATSSAKNAAGGISSAVKSALSPNNVERVGENTIQGFINGMVSKKAAAIKTAVELGAAAIFGLNKGAGCHSPSRLAFETAENVGLGAIIGIRKMTSLVANEGVAMGNAMLPQVTGPRFATGRTESMPRFASAGSQITNNIHVSLNYKAGEDANAIASEIAYALGRRLQMEG